MIEVYLQRHEQFLEQVLHDTFIPAPLIRSAMHYALFPGGKRLRPILIYLAGAIIEVDIRILDLIAAAVELTHCYSLIHDDLPAMDNDDLRRGKPSCHKAFDEATAILAGDGMQALAIELLLNRLPNLLNPAQVLAITQILVKASGVSGMVSGQSLDLSELNQSAVNEEQLQTIHLLKTGQLIQVCFQMVLAAQAEVDTNQQTALETYARHIGLVFQMQDDYLDYYAPTQVGKEHSSDLANQKTTFATLFSQKELEEKIAQYYEMAINALSVFGPKGCVLIELTQQLQKRSTF